MDCYFFDDPYKPVELEADKFNIEEDNSTFYLSSLLKQVASALKFVQAHVSVPGILK